MTCLGVLDTDDRDKDNATGWKQRGSIEMSTTFRSLRAVLCDFGFARKASKSNQMAMTICGTDEFMAPEVIFGMEYGLAADMFSMGVVACEMICRKVVGDQGFLVRTPQGSFGVDINEVKHHIHGTPPSSLMMWIEECLSNEAEDRINAVDAEGWLRDLIDELPKDESIPILNRSNEDAFVWTMASSDTNTKAKEATNNTLSSTPTAEDSSSTSSISTQHVSVSLPDALRIDLTN